MWLIPVWPLSLVAGAFQWGLNKYSPWDWLDNPWDWSDCYSAALRHIYASLGGVDNDKESGVNHIAHAIATLLILLTYMILRIGKDDRVKL